MFTMNGVHENCRVFVSGRSLVLGMDHVPAEEVLSRLRRTAAAVVREKGKRRSAHSQIMRIRAEDSHLGEDIGEGNLRVKDEFGIADVMASCCSRPLLPASPLSGKTAHLINSAKEKSMK